MAAQSFTCTTYPRLYDVASDMPAPENRGVMLIDEFSRVTGLDRPTADGRRPSDGPQG